MTQNSSSFCFDIKCATQCKQDRLLWERLGQKVSPNLNTYLYLTGSNQERKSLSLNIFRRAHGTWCCFNFNIAYIFIILYHITYNPSLVTNKCLILNACKIYILKLLAITYTPPPPPFPHNKTNKKRTSQQ